MHDIPIEFNWRHNHSNTRKSKRKFMRKLYINLLKIMEIVDE